MVFGPLHAVHGLMKARSCLSPLFHSPVSSADSLPPLALSSFCCSLRRQLQVVLLHREAIQSNQLVCHFKFVYNNLGHTHIQTLVQLFSLITRKATTQCGFNFLSAARNENSSYNNTINGMLLVSRVVAGPPQMGWYGMGWEREGSKAGVGQARNRCRDRNDASSA